MVRLNLASFFRQPVLYFTLAGVVIFLVDAWARREEDVVAVTADVRREVAADLSTRFMREPNDAEIEQGVQAWVETELLFREANALGLAENDAVIRDHLANKLRTMATRRNIVETPTDDELRAELSAHPERYVKPDTYDVSHVFINRSIAPDTFEVRVQQALEQLEAGADFRSMGDHFPRGHEFSALTQFMLEASLGVKLGNSLKPEQQGKWRRVSGSRGAHLVRLNAITSGQPTLENSREALIERLQAQAQRDVARQYIDGLREKFTIVYERDPTPGDTPGDEPPAESQ